MAGFMSWSNDGRGTVIVVLLKLWLQVEASKKATMSRQRGCCVAWWQYLPDHLPTTHQSPGHQNPGEHHPIPTKSVKKKSKENNIRVRNEMNYACNIYKNI
jgi:hypothetical protein